MSDRADDRWAIARLLLATHLSFLALCWAPGSTGPTAASWSRSPWPWPMVVATGSAIGFDGLPLLGSVVDLARVPLAGTLALCLAGLCPGWR